MRPITVDDFPPMAVISNGAFIIMGEYRVSVNRNAANKWVASIDRYPENPADNMENLNWSEPLGTYLEAMSWAITAFNQRYVYSLPTKLSRPLLATDFSGLGHAYTYTDGSHLAYAIMSDGRYRMGIIKLENGVSVWFETARSVVRSHALSRVMAQWNTLFPVRPSLEDVIAKLETQSFTAVNDILYYLNKLKEQNER